MREEAFAQRDYPGQEAVEISPLPSRPTALLTQQKKNQGQGKEAPQQTGTFRKHHTDVSAFSAATKPSRN